MRGMRNRLIPVALVVLTAAACTGETETAPASSFSPSPPITSTATTAVEPAPASTSAAITTVAPTTTSTSPAEGVVERTCEQLRTAGYATRVRAVARARARLKSLGERFDLVRQTCERALGWTRAAIAVQRRRDRQFPDFETFENDLDFSCADGRYAMGVTNSTRYPLGVHAVAWVELDGATTRYQVNDRLMVIWNIPLGSRRAADADFPRFTTGYACYLILSTFLADRSRADGAVPGGPGPDTRGRDPARWFPALVAAERDVMRSGDRDAFFAVQDVRGLVSPRALRASSADVRPKGRARPVSVRVCQNTVRRSGRHHVSFFAVVDYAPSRAAGAGPGTERGFLQSGLFRRGRDGRWRRIGGPMLIERVAAGSACRTEPAE
jgi:hypothetical protein